MTAGGYSNFSLPGIITHLTWNMELVHHTQLIVHLDATLH